VEPFHRAAAKLPPDSSPTPTQSDLLRQSIAENAPIADVRRRWSRPFEIMAKVG
jgi:hypothetical protein